MFLSFFKLKVISRNNEPQFFSLKMLYARATKRWIKNFKLRFDSLKGKFSLFLFVYNLMIEYSKKNRENFWENAFKRKNKKFGSKFNLELALISLWTTRPKGGHLL